MQTILLVAVNSSWSQSNPALFYLREIVRDLPYRVIFSTWVLKDQLLDILHGIFCQKANVVCFSAYIWNRNILEQLIPEVKQLLPKAVIVTGGPEAEHLQHLLSQTDHNIPGAGEATFRALAKQDFRGMLPVTKPIPLNQLPFPYRQSDLAMLQGKLVYYECYRGCPYNCVYCLSALDKRSELRFDPDSDIDLTKLCNELDSLLALQPKTLKFVDRSFNIHPKLSRFIWSYFIERGCSCDVHFEIFPDLLCEEDFAILKQAPEGRIRFEIGIQTTNPEVAALCGRNSSWEKARAALLRLKLETKVRIHADLISGLPGDDYASVLQSLNELCATLPDAVQLGTLKILPNTPMQQIAKQRGYKWLCVPPYQVLCSDNLNFDQMHSLENLAKLLALYWNKEEFAEIWKSLLNKQPATEILAHLLKLHQEKGFELHSVSKAKREIVMAELVAHFAY